MGRLGTFVPRLVALTVVWLLATTALTYAAAQRMNTATPAVPHIAAPSAPQLVVVPDVRRQAYVFAEGTLGDSGFAWRVAGSVHGFASNTVVSQSPAPGTQLIDTGSPTIVLHLAKSSAAQTGAPQDSSPVAGTAVKLADLAAAAPVAKPAAAEAPKKTAPVAKKAPVAKVKAKSAVKAKPAAKAKSAAKAKPAAKAPAKRAPAKRPPAFVVPDARREPLN